MSERIELPAKWRNVETGTLYAEPTPHVWCATYGDDHAQFLIEGGPLADIEVEPAPKGTVVTVIDDQAYRDKVKAFADMNANDPLYSIKSPGD